MKRLNGRWLRETLYTGEMRQRSRAWWAAVIALTVSLLVVASATTFLYSFMSDSLSNQTVSNCSALGGFGMGPNSYTAAKEGVLSFFQVSSTCSGSNAAFSSLTVTLSPFAGAINVSVVDALRFYWNGSVPAVATIQFSSTGTSFFTSGGPYGYLLVNSTTGGTYPVHNSDDCVGAGGISAPGTGNCMLQLLPLAAGVAGAVGAAGTTGNTATGLVNLSAPSTVICPPAGAAWNTGSSSCTPGSAGSIVAALAAGPSFLVLSFGFSDAPTSYPSGSSSFAVTVTASVVW